eukprot:scaffold243_cov175-Amphora_coffeaeformis.AAC.1
MMTTLLGNKKFERATSRCDFQVSCVFHWKLDNQKIGWPFDHGNLKNRCGSDAMAKSEKSSWSCS